LGQPGPSHAIPLAGPGIGRGYLSLVSFDRAVTLVSDPAFVIAAFRTASLLFARSFFKFSHARLGLALAIPDARF
jgi:hypothetical protein